MLFAAAVSLGGWGLAVWHDALHGAGPSGRYLDARFVPPSAWGPVTGRAEQTLALPLRPGSGALAVHLDVTQHGPRRWPARLEIRPGEGIPSGLTVEVALEGFQNEASDDPRCAAMSLRVTEHAADGDATLRVRLLADGRWRRETEATQE